MIVDTIAANEKKVEEYMRPHLPMPAERGGGAQNIKAFSLPTPSSVLGPKTAVPTQNSQGEIASPPKGHLDDRIKSEGHSPPYGKDSSKNVAVIQKKADDFGAMIQDIVNMIREEKIL